MNGIADKKEKIFDTFFVKVYEQRIRYKDEK